MLIDYVEKRHRDTTLKEDSYMDAWIIVLTEEGV